jgi:hypothetical protein
MFIPFQVVRMSQTQYFGPDGIPSRPLKECAGQIAPSLCDIFNHSLQPGRIPSIGKRYSDTQETTKRTRRKVSTYFPAPHSEQSFRTVRLH